MAGAVGCGKAGICTSHLYTVITVFGPNTLLDFLAKIVALTFKAGRESFQSLDAMASIYLLKPLSCVQVEGAINLFSIHNASRVTVTTSGYGRDAELCICYQKETRRESKLQRLAR